MGYLPPIYGLNRSKDYELKEDIVFLGDTLHKGVLFTGYFNTQVLSIGYMLSILTSEKSFLGVYFNAYVINLNTGLRSEVFNFDKKIGIMAPLPNFGVVALFNLKKWLTVAGGVGIFFINTHGINGSFSNINVSVMFIPAKWVGFSIGYQVFDVTAGFPLDQFRAIIDYNYNGPSVGLTFSF